MKKRIKLINIFYILKPIVIICLIIPFNLFAQDLIGIWEGHLFQNNQTNHFKLQINSNDTLVNFFGNSFLNNPANKEETEIVKHFSAHFKNGKFIFEENYSVKDNLELKFDCLIRGELKFEPEKSGMSLIGKWTSNKCGNGDIYLTFTGKGKIINYPVIYSRKDFSDMDTIIENSGNLLNPFPLNINIISPNIYFQQSEYRILRKSYPELNKLCKVLKENKNLKIKIEGHTDQIGNGKYNLILSEQRALEIKKYLVERGIGNERIKTFGYGDTFPRCPPPCKKNRRIEYMLY